MIGLLGNKQADQLTIGKAYSITDPQQTFFAYQDYYIPAGPESTSAIGVDVDREVTISLQQKFVERNTLDILVEVLQSDVDLEQINKGDHSPRMGAGVRKGRTQRESSTGRNE